MAHRAVAGDAWRDMAGCETAGGGQCRRVTDEAGGPRERRAAGRRAGLERALQPAGGGRCVRVKRQDLGEDHRLPLKCGRQRGIARARLGQHHVIDLQPCAQRRQPARQFGQPLAWPGPGTQLGEARLVDVHHDEAAFFLVGRSGNRAEAPQHVAGAFLDAARQARREPLQRQHAERRQQHGRRTQPPRGGLQHRRG